MPRSHRLPPLLRPTLPADCLKTSRSGPLGAADERARRRARQALSGMTRLALAGALAATLARSASPVSAEPEASFIVSNTLDDVSAPSGSLRAAIQAANANGVGLDTITFASNLSGRILLTAGQLSIESAVNIIGPGPEKLTVDGNALDSVFRVESNPATEDHLDVTISGLKITGGNATTIATVAGGGIYNLDENLTLNDVVITENDAVDGAGIYQSFDTGSLTILDSTISYNYADYGGGISAPLGTDLTIRDSTITGNTATGDGGGIYMNIFSLGQDVVIERSTISYNTSGGGGGGISINSNYGYGSLTIRQTTISHNTAVDGGGMLAGNLYTFGYAQLPITMENTTISNNSADHHGGGIFIGAITTQYGSGSGQVQMFNVTIANNTAGLARSGGGVMHTGNTINSAVTENDPAILIHNSVIANNTAGGTGNDLDVGAKGLMNLRYSLVRYPAPDTASQIIYTSDTRTGMNPLLGNLADNGGPTWTHLPDANSPLLNRGDPNFPTTSGVSYPQTSRLLDQRGSLRVLEKRLDIGAVERGVSVRLPFLVRSGAALLAHLVAGLARLLQ